MREILFILKESFSDLKRAIRRYALKKRAKRIERELALIAHSYPVEPIQYHN